MAMGTFGFGLMGHVARHMCPVFELMGYECPRQNAEAGGSGVHHLSTFQTLSRATTESSASMLFALLIAIALLNTAAVVAVARGFGSFYLHGYRETLREREESVFISRQQFSRWFALHTNRDSYAF